MSDRRPAAAPARAALLPLTLAALLTADAVRAAEVAVRGQELEGAVTGVTAEGVEFDAVYGRGTIVIPWADVERLRSDREFLVLYGDDRDVAGRLWGVEEGALLVGESPETATRVPLQAIFRSLTREQYEESPLEALRARYRFWHARFDLAFAYTDATTDTAALSTGLEVERKKAPVHLTLGAFYRYGTSRESGQARTTNEDRILGRARLDYDLFDAVFAFGSISGEYDDVQNLSLRLDPTAGLGWRFLERPKLTLSARSGLGYVYERFFGGSTDDYLAILFGGDLRAELPLGSRIEAHVEYLPAVDDWLENYLLRSRLVWSMPVVGWLDFQLQVIDNYDNQPAPGTDRNSFTSTAGLSFRF